MTKVKDVVAIVEELIYQKNLWYPYTIRKVLCSKSCQKYLKNYSEEQIDKVISVMENICHWIKGMSNVNTFNLSNVVSTIFIEKDEILKELFSCIEKNELNIEQSGYSKTIEEELKKIDYKILNEKVTDELIIRNFNSAKKVDFRNTIELEKTLLKLINNNNLIYSDLLIKFFLELDLEYFFKFRNDYKIREIENNEKGLISLLNQMSLLIYRLDKVFERDILFLLNMLELYLFSKNTLKDYFIDCLTLREDNYMSNKNFGIILHGFEDGLIHMKNYYLIESFKYNNSEYGNFRHTTESYQIDWLRKFCLGLENQSIYTVYTLSHIKNDSEAKQYKKQMESLINDITQKKSNILIRKQEITEEQKKLILAIMERLDKNQEIFRDVGLQNLNQLGREVTFLSFKAYIKKHSFDIRIAKYNKDLVWYVLYNRKKIIRELCVCVEDVERIIKLINNYIKEKELIEQYHLI